MRHWLRFAWTAAVLVVALGVPALTACASGPPAGPVPPGITPGALGGIEAVGFLSRSETGGDTWAVTDIKPGPSSAVRPRTLATLRPGSVDSVGIAALEGRYIWAAGRRPPSGSGSVPEVLVDGIDAAQEP